ncbi:aspartate--tRNA ligase, chloroplastic/mitochondrial-like isoform X2 [Macadamia integrifolia]|uniref:aspartate--tRNA ligase, chloroplastic/mitochondrial-like isoform X2 n=1 Tax=Macadamia integrifolia TaxID=60698 RepID=UPI001C4E810A|nr:aspartate--tRNA ligase, chloroplastic/mitochondrial-like isoform X2 [Macadamia integrifolia]
MSSILRALPFIVQHSRSFASVSFPFCRKFQKCESFRVFKRRISIASAASHSKETLVADPKPVIPVKETLEWVSRTRLCSDLSVDDVGKRVRLCGWVALHRIHGGVTFLNLRDHTGIVQVTTLPNQFPDAHSTVNELRLEYVIAVEGIIRSRPSESVNMKMKTGMIEVTAEHVQVLNSVRSKLPFLVTTAGDAKEFPKEEIRLRWPRNL